ncbi:Signal transduction histidine kinase [Prevotella sp. ne3005]|nr:Signal transduction histidine kinase [Prevotella sp. ne3005]
MTIIGFLTWWGLLYASNPDGRDAEEALAQIDNQIAQYHQKGDTEKESEARWQKIQTLKNFSMTEKQAEEALIQMEWFRNNQQWDNYYRSWQLRSNALSAMGKLQLALQETQRMLSDAKERNNKLGHAMAYKQIGVIYLNMKQTEPAVDALQHYAELMKDEESDISSLSNIYYRMAKAYDYDEAYDKELQVTNDWQRFLREKVGLRTDPEARECYNAWYLAKAAAYIGLKQFENAREALDSASYHAHLINTSLSLHHTYKMQARYYLARGDAANALLYTDSVRLVTNEKDDHTSEIRAQALMMLDRGSEAAEIYQRLYHEKDSVFGRDARQHLDELNTLFQIDELKTEQQRTKFRYTLIAASSIVLALVVLLIFGRRNTIRQKKVNEQLRIANERAIVSSKMKTEFIRNISHEIRTPLNIVSGFTQILTSPDMELPAGSKRDIQERVTENTDRITKLVDRMLELSDVNNETLIDRNDQTNALNIVSQAIDYSGIALHTRPGNADAAVVFNTLDNEELASSEALLTNSRYAVHALAQLLENAVKFTKEGSITLRMTSSGTKVCFSVEDTGIGIPADQTEHIFEEFVQLNEFADGAGIGLTVARSIAQRMGGNLWLDTDYTQGARFVLELLK